MIRFDTSFVRLRSEGSSVWLEPGIGAAATQSLVDFAYCPLGLEMMKRMRNMKKRRDWHPEMPRFSSGMRRRW